FLLPMMVILAALVSIFVPAHAQGQSQETWLPEFNPSQHVYIDPRLSDSQFAVSLPGLETQLAEKARPHGLAIYVIATEQGNERLPTGAKWGVLKVNELEARWTQRPGFPVDDYLIIVWVRFKNDHEHGSVGATGGSRLKGYGETKDRFSADTGPVMTALKASMRKDPQRALLTIADNVNHDIDAAIRAARDREDRRKFEEALPGYILTALLVILTLVVLLLLARRHSREKGRARYLISDWEDSLDSANSQGVELSDKYLTFLSQEHEWKSRFKGKTLKAYEAAVTDFSEFTVRLKLANQLLAAAKQSMRLWVFSFDWPFPFVRGFRKVISLLKTTEVTVTSDDLPIELATLFGGCVTKK